jgi:hypothetical protein
MSYVPDEMEKKADLFRERNKIYGNAYHSFGRVLKAYFGELHLDNHEDFGRAAILFKIMEKCQRYTQCFNKGGHDDSLDDISVYAMMLKELDHLPDANTNETPTMPQTFLSDLPTKSQLHDTLYPIEF